MFEIWNSGFKMSYLDELKEKLELWNFDNKYLAYAKYKSNNNGAIVAHLLVAFEEHRIVDIIEILTMYPNIINEPISNNGYTPFMIACSMNNTQLVKFMLSKGADIHKNTPYNDSVFYLAMFHYIRNPGDLNATCIRELYYAGCDINAPNGNGYTPLQMAAMFGHTPLAKWLLNKNASVSVYPHPIVIASSHGHQETAGFISSWVNSHDNRLN
ncbi:alpha-latrocrustotoxin-Lt1a isoform X2 [Aethina tumida]|uniref:alpha-latrocrustotoxin-Lt1a isoform X2 n=1 Tax=Aethina tumida TaxID=116153 RepID=UPI002148A1CC|nr:alpha-latrocrustotoxin-Lt1a isoform X2 [Aethina tumida]